MTMVEGSGDRISRYSLYLVLMVAFVVIYLPLILVVVFSFNDGHFQVFPLKGFTLEWYRKMFMDPAFMGALKNSLTLGAGVGVVATLFGFLGSYSLVKAEFPFKDAISSFLITPIAVPAVLLAVSLRVYFFSLGWQFSLWTVFLGHLIINIPLSVMIIRARLLQIPISLEEAAWDLGAGRLRSLWEVILPMTLPSILVSVLLTFTFSFDEFIIAYFLTQFELTLPIKIWSNLLTGFDPTVNAIGSIVFVISLTVVFFGQGFVFGRPKKN
jgi:spermidine/putrescine transport system permease protein